MEQSAGEQSAEWRRAECRVEEGRVQVGRVQVGTRLSQVHHQLNPGQLISIEEQPDKFKAKQFEIK